MTDNGLFNRRADPHDGRRVFIERSPAASLAMRRYFAEVGAVAAAGTEVDLAQDDGLDVTLRDGERADDFARRDADLV